MYMPTLKRAHWTQLAIVAGIVAALLVLVPTSTVLNTREGDRKLQRIVTTAVSPFDVAQGLVRFDGVLLLGNVTSVDVLSFSFKIHFTAQPWGSFDASNADNSSISRITTAARLIVAGKETPFGAGSIIPAFDAVVPIDEGSPNRYPFDEFSSTFAISLFAGTGFNQSVPMALALVGAVQSWGVGLHMQDQQRDSQLVAVTAVITRSWTTALFSVIIIVIMWALSLTVLTLAVTLWFRNRKVEPPTIAVAGSLLFALPALRNSQPGAPAIGASVDVAGFMWNMVLVAVACLLLMINYVIKYKKEKPAPAAAVQPAGTHGRISRDSDTKMPLPAVVRRNHPLDLDA
ncbi:hypothetical protein HK105_202539 [Polyrhizophydium stewartii]|uniref:DUF4436 domain-containing protein n=1 Tax=Polyrhizophydium stewartii TaxID=2732419 RepID=A0ABR4NDR9_9FUNG|nr:hypothetical protein HK105_002321 [Polyrhizophydium stewartii]